MNNIKKTIAGTMIIVITFLIIVGTFKGGMWTMNVTEKKDTVKIQMVIK